jgi:LacI family transcriptional regulator
MSNATIRDVARQAGVSVATVSRVLNGTARVADGTRQRILDAARQLHYQPHAAARSLSLRRTNAVGVVLPDLHGEFFSELLRGIDTTAQRAGLHLLVSSSHHDRTGIAAALHAMRGRVDGLLVMTPDLDAAALAESLPAGIPVVLVSCDVPGGDVDVLWIDNVGGAHAVVRHLLALGHRRIAHVGGSPQHLDARMRRQGWQDALRTAGVEPDDALVAEGDFTEEGGWRATLSLLARSHVPTAVFAASDAMAVGVMGALREHGVCVPGDVSVVGFDDIALARYVTPPLTTVRVAADRLGARATELLLGRAGAERPPPAVSDAPRRELLPAELVTRASTAPPPSRAPARPGASRTTRSSIPEIVP